MKREVLAVGLSWMLVSGVLGQTADRLLLEGRLELTTKNLTNANAKFTTAQGLSPEQPAVNALLSATRLLVLPYASGAQGLMDRLGMTLTGRTVYALSLIHI